MQKLPFTLFRSALALSLGAWTASAGEDTPAPRKQFRQSTTYPFIFRSESYLASSGPVPLRFGAPTQDCSRRAAPPLPAAAKGHEKAPAPPPAQPADANPVATYPAPQNGPRADAAPAAEGAVDFSRAPDEVMDFFRDHDGRAGKRIYLFDPIFQPVRPNDLPRSKATLSERP